MVLLRIKVPASTASHRAQQANAEVGVDVGGLAQTGGQQLLPQLLVLRQPQPGADEVHQAEQNSHRPVACLGGAVLQTQRRMGHVHQPLALVGGAHQQKHRYQGQSAEQSCHQADQQGRAHGIHTFTFTILRMASPPSSHQSQAGVDQLSAGGVLDQHPGVAAIGQA